MEIHAAQTGPLEVNTFILPLAGRAVLLVDPAGCDFSGDEKKLAQVLDEHDCAPVGILLTHGHFDHVCGLKALRSSFPNLPIAIHVADQKYLGPDSVDVHKKSLGLMSWEEDDFLKDLSDLPLPNCLLKDGDSLDTIFKTEDIISAFTGDEVPDVEGVANALSHWRVIHTPGHTEGSVCFYNESEKVLISGDTVFYQSYGRTDLPGGNEDQMQKSLSEIFETIPDDVLVYPGHGAYGFEIGANK
ncbi:MAG: MBL fold metallo-hydrolase [Treponema sp.]|nr:MBL fold metallo-hydrolase [Treponema sp.]